MPLDKQGTML